MGFKRERTQRHSNVYLSSYCNRVPHNEKVPIQKARCKRIYKMPILRPRGLILRPWAPTVVLQRLVQVFAWAPKVLVTKAYSGF